MNSSPDQIRNFFAALCYASNHISVFEQQLVKVSEQEIPILLLASIIFENCGLQRIKEDLPAAIKSSSAYYVPIPNQYILKDQAWLYPVIRACDPNRRIFTGSDYSSHIVGNIRDCLGIDIRNKEKEVVVDLRDGLMTVAYIISHPELVGLSKKEIDDVVAYALSEDIYGLLRKRDEEFLKSIPTTASAGNEDLSRGLTALLFLIAVFVSSCLLIGQYCLD